MEEDLRIEVARIQEIINSIRDSIQDLKSSDEKFQAENLKRHEETRDSYYLAEMTRKRFEEQYDLIQTKLVDLNTKIEELREKSKEDRKSDTETLKALKADLEEVKAKQDSKWLMIAKIILLLLTGFITGSLSKLLSGVAGL